MTPIFATSYEGLAEGLFAFGMWVSAMVLFLAALTCVCVAKWRPLGRKLAIAAGIVAIPQLAAWTYWSFTERGSSFWGSAFILVVSALPAVGSGLVLWLTPRKSDEPEKLSA
jgi:hypothetical protein